MADVDRTIAVYPIGVVEKLTGLTGRQIRYYEKTGLVIPARTQGNQRLYAPIDVDRLLRVKELLAEGLNVEGVRAILSKESEQAAGGQRAEAGGSRSAASAGPESPGVPNGRDAAETGAAAGETDVDSLASAATSATSLGQVGSWETLRLGRRLGSLYPVDNQAELLRLLQQQRRSESNREGNRWAGKAAGEPRRQ
ncbi:MAG: MerR family transcriptional regulator [Limnochordaceae bacterium]|nr:MerR family transcriptional regulator [Limnochordaceae bacterium]